MSLSALPLILSNKVGASSLFLDLNNGYSFSPLNQAELQSALEQIMNKTDYELWQLAENSYQNGLKLTQKMWSKSIHQIYNSTACVE
jgi:glycosyltransferase involved in cell wall biosynthesis